MAARENQTETGNEAGSSIQVLKWIVIFGGIGLLVGFLFLFMEMQQRGNARREAAAQAPPVTDIPLAVGGRAGTMVPAGSGVALLVDTPAHGQEVLLLDREGNLTRRVRLLPEK